MKYILTNCNIINGISDSLIKGKSVVVKDDIIEDITENILPYKDYKIIDLKKQISNARLNQFACSFARVWKS